MVDRSVVYLIRVVEDVLIKFYELIVPAEFFILDIEENPNGEEDKLPFILGKALMA